MGIVFLLVAGLALLMGLIVMPTVVEVTDIFALGDGTPLAAIISLMPLWFLAIIIIGTIWALVRRT